MGRLVEMNLRHGQQIHEEYMQSITQQDLMSNVVKDILNNNAQILTRLEKKTQRLHFRLDPKEIDQLGEIAAKYKLTTTELLRIGIEACNLATQP